MTKHFFLKLAKSRWFFITTLFMSLLALHVQSVAADTIKVTGVDFPIRSVTGESTLELRGAAMLRWVMMVDLYAGAFYLPGDAPSRQWPSDIPKRLELCYFRKIPAKGFVESSQDHLRSTLSAEKLEQIQDRLYQLYDLFRDIGPGDRYTLTYQPDYGTSLSLNGELLGTIPGADFAAAYFGIWLGVQPLNEKFRDQVLGFSAS
jgi:hypothetical protein